MALISLKTIKNNVSCAQTKLTDFKDGQPDLGEVLGNALISEKKVIVPDNNVNVGR
ncbi:MAG: hypothetical protein LBD03_08490 [Methanobrevibacter sp.]|jgi:hypothetical protein|nr:hypothetical protein [Candidatus Methanovirga procula]